eukprot:2558121-Prymnesium_polylepis.1
MSSPRARRSRSSSLMRSTVSFVHFRGQPWLPRRLGRRQSSSEAGLLTGVSLVAMRSWRSVELLP